MPPTSPTETDPTEPRYHHGDLRQTLVSAALNLLTEEQNWDFSLREVARRAGVSHNAPYNHFQSKQDLLAAVAAAGFDKLRAEMQEAAAPVQTSAAALKAIGVAYVRFGVENPAHYRLMFGAVLATAKDCPPPVVEESAAAAKGLLRSVIRQGVEDGSFALSPDALETGVLAAWALVHGLTMLLLDGLAETAPLPASSSEQIAAQVSQLLLDGLTNSQAG